MHNGANLVSLDNAVKLAFMGFTARFIERRGCVTDSFHYGDPLNWGRL